MCIGYLNDFCMHVEVSYPICHRIRKVIPKRAGSDVPDTFLAYSFPLGKAAVLEAECINKLMRIDGLELLASSVDVLYLVGRTAKGAGVKEVNRLLGTHEVFVRKNLGSSYVLCLDGVGRSSACIGDKDDMRDPTITS